MAVVNGAHSDGQNQQFGILGVIGTLGTADVQGTAPTLPLGANPLTGALYVEDLSGASGTSNVQGSVQVTGGSIVVTNGTIGTIGDVGKVHNAGTIAGGTLGVISSLTSGTVSVNTTGTITSGSITVVAGTIGMINAGTITSSGTTTGVGVVSNITNGTIRVTAGTMIQTIGTVNSGTMNTGTLNAGTINAGTFTMTVGTLNSGTINAGTMNTGTLNAGTINAGTFKNDGRTSRNIVSFATTIAFGGSAFATLVGSAAVGAGTSIWVNDVSIVNNGGTQKYGLVFGSAINGSAVLAKGQFGPQGGIQKSFPMPVNAGMTNFDLNAWAEGAGTADFTVSYFISA